MQPTGTVWSTLIGDHPGIIPVKFGQYPISGFRGEDVKVKKLTDDDGQRPVTIAHPEHFVLGWAKNNRKRECDFKVPIWFNADCLIIGSINHAHYLQDTLDVSNVILKIIFYLQSCSVHVFMFAVNMKTFPIFLTLLMIGLHIIMLLKATLISLNKEKAFPINCTSCKFW